MKDQLTDQLKGVLDELKPHLSTTEPRVLLQRYWAQRLGILQQRFSQLLGRLVTGGHVVLHEGKDGNANLYSLPKGTGGRPKNDPPVKVTKAARPREKRATRATKKKKAARATKKKKAGRS
jgi:hypothetical protein